MIRRKSCTTSCHHGLLAVSPSHAPTKVWCLFIVRRPQASLIPHKPFIALERDLDHRLPTAPCRLLATCRSKYLTRSYSTPTRRTLQCQLDHSARKLPQHPSLYTRQALREVLSVWTTAEGRQFVAGTLSALWLERSDGSSLHLEVWQPRWWAAVCMLPWTGVNR